MEFRNKKGRQKRQPKNERGQTQGTAEPASPGRQRRPRGVTPKAARGEPINPPGSWAPLW